MRRQQQLRPHRILHTMAVALASIALLGLSLVPSANATAVRANAGFTTTTFPGNDDGTFPGAQSLGFTVNFFGLTFSSAFINNNGNITFDAPLGTFTPFPLTSTSQQIIAPFFADVDTRAAGSPVTFGTDIVDGHLAFGVNWIDVDYFSSSATHTNRNSFQLVLIDRSDIAAGDFDIEFNYDQIQWEAGTASGSDANGLGGFSARAGFSNGTGNPGTFFELTGSAVNGAFLDSGPLATALIHNRFNSTEDGRYVFQARNGGIVVEPVPEPGTITLLGIGMLGLAGYGWRRRQATAGRSDN